MAQRLGFLGGVRPQGGTVAPVVSGTEPRPFVTPSPA
jgi:hypothetical protein